VATVLREVTVSDLIVSMADHYAESAMESLPLVSEDQRKPILAGAFLSFLQDFFALVEGVDG
jgi:hypothetical protein